MQAENRKTGIITTCAAITGIFGVFTGCGGREAHPVAIANPLLTVC